MPITGFNLATMPLHDAIAEASPDDPEKLLVGKAYVDWFSAAVQRIDSSPHRLTSVQLQNQQAAISTTPLPLGTTGGGVGRVSYYFRIKTAASTSSSWQITFTWTDGGVSCAFAGTPVTTNTVNSVQGDVLMVRADAPAVITYAVTYSSAGTVPMAYNLDIVLESMMPTEAA
jgi:hypothetical protein